MSTKCNCTPTQVFSATLADQTLAQVKVTQGMCTNENDKQVNSENTCVGVQGLSSLNLTNIVKNVIEIKYFDITWMDDIFNP